MNKKTLAKTLVKVAFAVLLLFLGFKQYVINSRLEYYAVRESYLDNCNRYSSDMPASMTIKLLRKEISRQMYKSMMEYTVRRAKEPCGEFRRIQELNPFYPWTDEWHKYRSETGLSNLVGYIKDLFNEPYPVQGEWYDNTLARNVLVKTHSYGGGPAHCAVVLSMDIKGSPLPFLSRMVYSLYCTNDKSESEDVTGFMITTTSDNMERVK